MGALFRMKVEATHWVLWAVPAEGLQEPRVEQGVRLSLMVEMGGHCGYLSWAVEGRAGRG